MLTRHLAAVVALAVVLTTAPPLGVQPAAASTTDPRPAACRLSTDPAIAALVAARRPHPRVVVGRPELARARTIDDAADPTASSLDGRRTRQQLRHATSALSEPLPSRAGSLSLTGRRATERLTRLAYAMAALENGTPSGAAVQPSAAYANRIRAEVAALVALPDWGSVPPIRTGEDSLLETAEVMTAVAVGFSLTAPRMSRDERARTVRAIVDKGLVPTCAAWSARSWMVESTHNWGVVTNAGAAMGALAVADQQPALAATVLSQALPRANRAVRADHHDGGSPEGPSYAGLSHTYLAYLTVSLEHTLGADGRRLVGRVPGAAAYLDAVTGPSGLVFNYANANTGQLVPLLALVEARRGGDPLGDVVAQRLLDADHANTLLLLWSSPTRVSAPAPPLVRSFPRSGVATLRSGHARTSTFVGVIGGDNASNHGHLDLGSFVLDRDGQRFVSDPGNDDYRLPGYTNGPSRFGYWRLATAGHSTVGIRGRNQSLTARAPVTVAEVGTTRRAALDLTAATGLASARREFELTGDRLVVRDRLRSTEPGVPLRWTVQTEAAVTVAANGRSAVLTRGGARTTVRLDASTPGTLRAERPPTAPPGGLSTAGFTTLVHDTRTAVPAGGGTPERVVTVVFDR